mgnify:CR=1 FL=1
MEKVTICKVSFNEDMFKVNMLVDENGISHGYRVMRGRNVAKGGSFFNDERAAIMFALRAAFNEVAQLNLPIIL